MSGRRVLVTGGAGYIGSHTCKALAQAGYELCVYDDLSTGHAELVKWGTLEQGDLRDAARLRDVFSRFRPDAVMHFAALATLPACAADPALCEQVNVQGTANLLAAMRESGCSDIVFSSSCAVYSPDNAPLHENSALGPQNVYGHSKLAGENLCFKTPDIRAVALRYFNAAGADADGECGEWHEPETHALPLLIAAACGKGQTFRLFGTDYPTPDGSAIRDYIHVSDLANAHVRALDYLQNGGEPVALNVGGGRGVSVKELLAAVEKATGRSVPVQHCPRREGDPVQLVADARKINAVLGWQPSCTTIETIVGSALAWHKRQWEKE